jgi:hypothetical protein
LYSELGGLGGFPFIRLPSGGHDTLRFFSTSTVTMTGRRQVSGEGASGEGVDDVDTL